MTVPVLLDTCAAMWIMENERLKLAAEQAIDLASDHAEPVFVTPITGWEIGLLAMKGRFRSRYSPQRWLEVLLAMPRIRLAEMPPHVLLQSCFLPGSPPREPSDRIVAATAREYGFTVMTRDRELLEYARQGHLSALEC
jgi:PIN domain nuclease of toxin-antitoxin system